MTSVSYTHLDVYKRQMWSYDEGHVVVGDIRSRHQKRFFWDTVDDSFKVRTQDAPEGILLPKKDVYKRQA